MSTRTRLSRLNEGDYSDLIRGVRSRLPGLLVFAASCLAAVMCLPARGATRESAREEVLRVVRAYHRAGMEGDVQHVHDLVAEDITHFHIGTAYRFTGRDAVVDDFRQFARVTQQLNVEMLDPMVQLASDDVAIVTYYMSENWMQDGKANSTTEKATEVYVRGRESQWSQVHTHYSKD